MRGNIAAEDPGAPVEGIVTRIIIGSFAWAVGTAALVSLMFLSAIPYGGGSVAPVYLVIPWTAAVIYWALKPLDRLPFLSSSPATRLLIFAAAFGSAMSGMYWWLGSGEREKARDTSAFAAAFERHSTYLKKVCANAGVKVFRRVRDVSSIVVYGIRPKADLKQLDQKDFVGDVYSEIDTSSDPVRSFLRNFLTKSEWETRSYVPSPDETNRYSLIEVPAEVDGVSGFYRYSDASVRSEFKTNREFAKTATSSYAVHIEDISSAADREHWIAGTKWSAVDVKTHELLGEFIAYAIDPLQGETVFKGGSGNGWAPWLRAGNVEYRLHGMQNACPEKDILRQRLNSREFMRSVLEPIKQEVRIIPAS